MYIKINNEGAKKALVSISIMVIIIIASTSAVVVSLAPLSSVEGARQSNNPPVFKSIKKFDSDGKFISSWGSEGDGNGQFLRPEAVAVDSSSGNVFVADFEGNNIQKFDSNGNFITKWGSEGDGDGQFQEPWGVAVDSSGNVYTAETNGMRIQKFDSNGNFITKWGSEGTGEDQSTST